MHVDFNPTNSILLTIVDILKEYGVLILAEREDNFTDAKTDSSQELYPEVAVEIISFEDKQE